VLQNPDITQYKKAATCAVSWESWTAPRPKRSAFISQEKYIGMDIHQATNSVAVMGQRQADHGMLAGNQSSHDS
jgi:hypothetical protein